MWLLEPETRKLFAQSCRTLSPTLEDRQKFDAAMVLARDEGVGERILTVAGSTAEIKVEGILTQAPNFMSFMFGGGRTTYGEVIAALAQAQADPDIEKIILAIDSPGGQFDGLFSLIEALQANTKPLTAVVNNVAASAAFAVAAQADTITASNRAARIGSVGVVASIDVFEDEIIITSTDAPKKRPDVTTPEGVAMVREELDAMHEIFAESIALGRGTTTDRVNADFGEGATLLAEAALKAGMIDAVSKPTLRIIAPQATAASGTKPMEVQTMDKNKLMVEHPELFAAVVLMGVTQERDRVTAHLTMGSGSGDMTTAMAAIEAGDDMTATLQAKYMMAATNRRDTDDRQADNTSALDDAAGDGGIKDKGDVSAQEAKAAEALTAATFEACNLKMGGVS